MKENLYRHSLLLHPSFHQMDWIRQSKWSRANLVNENWKEEQPSNTTWCGPKKELLFSSVEMVFSTGRSIHDAPERGLLRKMRMEEGSVHALGLFALLLRDFCWLFLSRNANASVPSTIESRAGKSITHSLLIITTLKGDVSAELTTTGTQLNGGQKRQVYSSLWKEMNHSRTLPVYNQ